MDSYTVQSLKDAPGIGMNDLLPKSFLEELQVVPAIDWSLLELYGMKVEDQESFEFGCEMLSFLVESFPEYQEDFKKSLLSWPRTYRDIRQVTHKLRGASAYTVARRFTMIIQKVDSLIVEPSFQTLPSEQAMEVIQFLSEEMVHLTEMVKQLQTKS